jgi:hypothetical protein
LVERVVQLAGVDAQAVLVADVDRDGAIAAQVPTYWSRNASGALAAHLARISGLRRAVLRRQIEVERRRSAGSATTPAALASCARAEGQAARSVGALALATAFSRSALAGRAAGDEDSTGS